MIDLHKLFAKSYLTSETSLYTHSDLHYCVSSAQEANHTANIYSAHCVLIMPVKSINPRVIPFSVNRIYLLQREGRPGCIELGSLGRGGDGDHNQTIPLPLISLKSPMCRKASYLLNGLSIVWLYKGKINLNSSSSSNAFSLESGTQIELDSKTSGIHTCKLILMFDNAMQ